MPGRLGTPERRDLAILCAGALHEHGLGRLRSAGHEVRVAADATEEEICRAAEDADVIIAHGGAVSSEVIESARKLRLIAACSAGIDRVAVGDATRRGVLVQTTASSGTTAAAEVIVSLMLSAARHIVQACASLKAGSWSKRDLEGTELRNKTLCLVGVDGVAAHVAALSRALGMRVVAYDPALSMERAAALGIEKARTLRDALAASDVLSLHSPLTKATRGLVADDALAAVRAGAILVNASRPELVAPDALQRALDSGRVAAAAMDFGGAGDGGTGAEDPWRGLREHPRCTFTRGLAAGSAARTPEREADDLADALLATLQGKAITCPANAAFVSSLDGRGSRAYVQLAEAMASLHAQTAVAPPRGITVSVGGPALRSAAMRDLLAAVAVREVLGTCAQRFPAMLADAGDLRRINLVNAMFAAKAMGVEVSVSGSAKGSPTYANVVRLTVVPEGGASVPHHCREIAGSVLNGEPHIVSVDNAKQFPVFRPRTNVMLIRNEDRAGAVHGVLERLSELDVNIARLGVARDHPGSEAMAVLILDDPVSPSQLEEIRASCQLPAAHVASFMGLHRKWNSGPMAPLAVATASSLPKAGPN